MAPTESLEVDTHQPASTAVGARMTVSSPPSRRRAHPRRLAQLGLATAIECGRGGRWGGMPHGGLAWPGRETAASDGADGCHGCVQEKDVGSERGKSPKPQAAQGKTPLPDVRAKELDGRPRSSRRRRKFRRKEVQKGPLGGPERRVIGTHWGEAEPQCTSGWNTACSRSSRSRSHSNCQPRSPSQRYDAASST